MVLMVNQYSLKETCIFLHTKMFFTRIWTDSVSREELKELTTRILSMNAVGHNNFIPLFVLLVLVEILFHDFQLK